MGINLSKGQNINLSKTVSEETLSNLRAAIGWSENKFANGAKFDLDISVFALEANENGYKLVDVKDFCFYNCKQYTGSNVAANGALTYSGDNRTGAGEGDDEFIDIDLSKTKSGIVNYSIIVSISDPEGKGLNFGMVSDCYVRITNKATNEEVCKYDLAEEFSTETAVQVGSIYLYNNEWKFKAIGSGYTAGLDAFISEYQFEG